MDKIHSRWRKSKSRYSGGRGVSLKKAQDTRINKTAEPKPGQQQIASVAPSTATVATQTVFPPIPGTSKSQAKLARFSVGVSNDMSNDKYFLVSFQCIRNLVESFPCPVCMNNSVKLSVDERLGFSVKLLAKCCVCELLIAKSFSSPRVQDKDSTRAPFDVNRRMTMGFLDLGAGYSAMSRIFSAMAINCMNEKSFYNHLGEITEDTKILRDAILKQSRAAVRAAHEELNPSLKDQAIIDITGSLDGSWMRRGHVSLYGFVAVIDVLTGLVVDFEILSKFCLVCSVAESKYGKDSPEFLE